MPEAAYQETFEPYGMKCLLLENAQEIKRNRNLDKLDAIALLGENWNGHGAKPFSRTLIERARHVILNLDVQPEVFPTAANSIQIEYEKENGEYLEIQIVEDGPYEGFRIYGDETEEIFTLNPDVDEINEAARSFYE